MTITRTYLGVTLHDFIHTLTHTLTRSHTHTHTRTRTHLLTRTHAHAGTFTISVGNSSAFDLLTTQVSVSPAVASAATACLRNTYRL